MRTARDAAGVGARMWRTRGVLTARNDAPCAIQQTARDGCSYHDGMSNRPEPLMWEEGKREKEDAGGILPSSRLPLPFTSWPAASAPARSD
jgi:hypothetical protein